MPTDSKTAELSQWLRAFSSNFVRLYGSPVGEEGQFASIVDLLEAKDRDLAVLEKAIIDFGNLLAEAEARASALEAERDKQREGLSDYDAGLLNDFGGGNTDWWWDYLRSEIGRANEHWRVQISALLAPAASGERTVAWLIERDDLKPAFGYAPTPHWYAERFNGHDWTNDASYAKRFATKAEAEAFPAYRMIASDPHIRLTEHVFLGAASGAEQGGEDV